MFSNGKGERQGHCSEYQMLLLQGKQLNLNHSLSSNAHARSSTPASVNLPNSASSSPQLQTPIVHPFDFYPIVRLVISAWFKAVETYPSLMGRGSYKAETSRSTWKPQSTLKQEDDSVTNGYYGSFETLHRHFYSTQEFSQHSGLLPYWKEQ